MLARFHEIDSMSPGSRITTSSSDQEEHHESFAINLSYLTNLLLFVIKVHRNLQALSFINGFALPNNRCLCFGAWRFSIQASPIFTTFALAIVSDTRKRVFLRILCNLQLEMQLELKSKRVRCAIGDCRC